MSSKVAALRKGADLSKGVGPLKRGWNPVIYQLQQKKDFEIGIKITRKRRKGMLGNIQNRDAF